MIFYDRINDLLILAFISGLQHVTTNAGSQIYDLHNINNLRFFSEIPTDKLDGITIHEFAGEFDFIGFL